MSSQTDKDNKSTDKKDSSPSAPWFGSGVSSLLILALIALWMLSGKIVIGGSDTDKVPPIAQSNEVLTSGKPSSNDKKLFTVRARLFNSRPRKEILHIRARSEADIRVEVRAQTAGMVEKIEGQKGRLVKKGELLCRLDKGAKKAMLAQAQALMAQTKSDYVASRKLSRKGFSAKLDVNAKKAAYDGAIASVEQANIDLEHTLIEAPFTGIIEEQSAKAGDFLNIASPCAKLVKLHPLLIVGEVSERNIAKLKTGQWARAELVTGEKIKGRIRYISPTAKTQTRTFRIELEVSNPRNRMRHGVTADIFIPLQSTSGHLISPAFLTLNDAGEIGVRCIEEHERVKFLPVTILAQEKAGVWIKGLPQRTVIITVGQDYVMDGQRVRVVMEEGGI